MLLKYSVSSGVNVGPYSFPLQVKEEEVPLVILPIPELAQGDAVQLEVGIDWEKIWDIGELKIMIRKDQMEGPILFETEETCFMSTYSVLKYTDTNITAASHWYALSVKSTNIFSKQARLTGNVKFIGSVIVP